MQYSPKSHGPPIKKTKPMRKRTESRSNRSTRRSRPPLAEDACPSCGTAMAEKRGRLGLPVNGEEVAVPGAQHLRCPKCGEIVLTGKAARRLGEDAIAIYRRRHGLLSADQIRGIRERFGLTQAAF